MRNSFDSRLAMMSLPGSTVRGYSAHEVVHASPSSVTTPVRAVCGGCALSHAGSARVIDALEAGASVYVLKDTDPFEIVAQLRSTALRTACPLDRELWPPLA